jgi:hypothetical protein
MFSPGPACQEIFNKSDASCCMNEKARGGLVAVCLFIVMVVATALNSPKPV